MMRLLLSVCLLAAAVSAAVAQSDDEDVLFEIGASFYAPSRNIYCNYLDRGGEDGTAFHDEGSEIHCVLLKPELTLVVLTGRGDMKVSHPASTDNEPMFTDTVLDYGQTSKSGLHVCTSGEDGMACTVRGKGFLLSKQGVKPLP